MKRRKRKQENLVGLLNRTASVRFILLVDMQRKRYSVSVLKPDHLVMQISPKAQQRFTFEVYDSMDDLQEGISELARGYRPDEVDHVHCSKGGVEHTHKVDKLGLKIGECPGRKIHRSRDR